ncbi:MAG TPA: branched-chain amino acid ABC transporter permease [Anaerolineae bacterium]|nr:branched-chain amino acid ABC transporter permease [Anaerolineae bacterium]
MTLQGIVQSLVSGIVMGGIYGLMALGLNLIFGVMRIINLAHGEMMMLGMYAAWGLFTFLGVDPLLSLLIVVPGFFALAPIIKRLLIDPLLKAGLRWGETEFLILICTFGLSTILRNGAILAFKSDYRGVTTSYSTVPLSVAGISISYGRLASFGLALLLSIGLFAFFARTYTGKAIRATVQDEQAALLMGVNVERISMLTFSIGVAAAAAAGVLLSMVITIYPEVGGGFLLRSFCIIVLGGMGTAAGAVVGGLILGVAEAFSSLFIPVAYTPALAYVLLVLVLLVRPAGILGRMRA